MKKIPHRYRNERLIAALMSLLFAWQVQGVSGRPLPPEEGGPLSVSDSTYRRVIREGSLSMSCHLNYPQGSAKVQPDFQGNGEELFKLDRFIRRVLRDTLIYVDSIRLVGYCSIEGSYDLNDRLARNRVMGFKSYLDNEYELSERYPIRIDWVAEDWESLRRMADTSQMDYRNEVLFLIDNTNVFEGREKKLMDLAGGDPYKYMLEVFFPGLRRVEITVDYDLHRIIEEKLQRKLSDKEFEAELLRERQAAEAEEQRLAEEARQAEAARIAAVEAARTAAQQEALLAQQRQAEAARLRAQREAAEAARAARLRNRENRKLYPLIGVKTNLLAWAGLTSEMKMTTFMPNLEAEVHFGGRWSADVSGSYAHCAYQGGKQFWGLSAYSGEARFWFRNDGLFRGFYAGVYGQAGDFDNQKDRRDDGVTTTNYTGTFWSAGIAAGYLLPLARHWNLELSLRGGYRSAKYDQYDRELPYLYYNRSDKQNKFTLTGLKLNVVYRFGQAKP